MKLNGLQVKLIINKNLKIHGGDSRVEKQGIIKYVTKYLIGIQYENGVLESFNKSDIISPLDFIIKVKVGDKWKQLKIINKNNNICEVDNNERTNKNIKTVSKITE